MEVERFDHLHIKYSDLDRATEKFDEIVGGPFLPGLDFTEDYGMCVSFCPYPKGLELMQVTDASKEMAALYEAQPDGLFAISYKVVSLEDAIQGMQEIGYSMMLRYEFGEIKEALFDTKAALGFFVEMIEYEGEDIQAADYRL
jgi:hypothetical protein